MKKVRNNGPHRRELLRRCGSNPALFGSGLLAPALRVIFQTGARQRSDRNFQHPCKLGCCGLVGIIQSNEVAVPGPSYQPKYDGPLDLQPIPPELNGELFFGPAPMKPPQSQSDGLPGLVSYLGLLHRIHCALGRSSSRHRHPGLSKANDSVF